MQQLRNETTYQDSMLSVGLDLTSLTPGRSYELVITTTDGKTLDVAFRQEFFHQGETGIRFVSA